MKNNYKRTGLIISLIAVISCIGGGLYFFYNKPHSNKKTIPSQTVKNQAPMNIVIQPVGKGDELFDMDTYDKVRKVLPNVGLNQPTKIPKSAYVKDRGRYRADSIIHWLNTLAKPNEVYVGITMNDISTTKGSVQDWGVMGLGYCPGHACVVSSFRVKHLDNYFKVVLHEIGHTMGLNHCPVKTCYMRDAEGHDSTGEETDFCPKCKSFLKTKGWKL